MREGRPAEMIDQDRPPRASRPPAEPWDWEFYSEQVRTAQASPSTRAPLKPYLELEQVLAVASSTRGGSFTAWRFEERHDLPVYHPDVRVFRGV